jgi:hypothetical protein
MCGTAKDGAVPDDGGAAEEDQWQCARCTVINQAFSVACLCCGSSNPNPVDGGDGDVGGSFLRVLSSADVPDSACEAKLQALCTHVVFREEKGAIFGRSTDRELLECLVALLGKEGKSIHIHVLACRAVRNLVEVTEMGRVVTHDKLFRALLGTMPLPILALSACS